jgi:hypothetical protein
MCPYHSGDVRLQGQVYVRDLIGDAATASKRAAESIDQMKAKMSGKINTQCSCNLFGYTRSCSSAAAEI